ncbi:hypothetical protein SXCC_01565 [Gluconacetobacter sp. SXCC-1]|nr:hypothetical protein SXCC_01565 [Gluconacetobacter sp. SXCC-1]
MAYVIFLPTFICHDSDGRIRLLPVCARCGWCLYAPAGWLRREFPLPVTARAPVP